MIKYRELGKDERLSATHICLRCETEQLRGQLHHCTATEAWKVAKAAMYAENPVPPPSTSRPAKAPANDEENGGVRFTEDGGIVPPKAE